MLEPSSHLPPAIVLLLTEILGKCEDYHQARKKLRDLIPEIKRRSEDHQFSIQAHQYQVANPTGMDIYLDGGLNIFKGDVSCINHKCREQTALRIARSMGLIADTIWLTDTITEKFIKMGRATNEKLDALLMDALVLSTLLPFIVAGVIKFRPAWTPSCRKCIEKFEDQVSAISDELLHNYSSSFSMEPNADGSISLYTGDAYDPPLSLMFIPKKTTAAHLSQDEEFCNVIHRAVRSALWAGRDAALGRGAVFSNSKIGLAGLAIQERSIRNRSELQLLDETRLINVPWVSDLNPLQILQLRSEASKALPAFRQLMSKHLTNESEKSTPNPADIINELRFQATEVRNELENTSKHSARYWKTGYLTLGLGLSAFGLGLSVYGSAPWQTAAATSATGLLPLIQLLIAHKTGTEKDVDKLERKPGYVLVKAQDLLAHAH